MSLQTNNVGLGKAEQVFTPEKKRNILVTDAHQAI
jgi:hypothetical protein